ncbi:DUF47 domain-containing protein [Faecalicatena fissicatena]|uniref:DUF47 family protein n=1 Tax=Faecalicatena fissicatena TaxID=290055 RepID=A0ABS2E628_9FIRM|nr:DUF47 family protein [Faecalicatena fissicatena]MBM6737087.1 DUF47 family protein [Faecalicatena fissicatena]
MSKKQDAFYYDNFAACAELARKATHFLKEKLTAFDPAKMEENMEEIHRIEHEADEKKHQLTDRLAKAFITPIEREDIISLSYNIDELTDKAEEVFIRIYMNNVQAIRPDALKMLDIVIACTEEVCALVKEFPDFRRSKKLNESIIRINSLEEQADRIYFASMRALHTEGGDVLEILAWREIYTYLEKCADACEHVADVVEEVVMKNS